jgi:hypothetical protein
MKPEGLSSRNEQLPSYVSCLLILLIITGALRVLSFATTLRAVQRRADRRPDPQPTIETAEAFARRVAIVAAILPGRLRCLEQSLTLYYLLRRRGASVELKIGVQPYRFSAHAWIEYRGQPLNERNEIPRKVVAFPEIRL